MRESKFPIVLWNYDVEHHDLINKAVPRPLFQDQGKKPHNFTFGTQSNIYSVWNVGCHEWVYYRNFGSFPENKEKLGRILRTWKNEGGYISQSIVDFSSCEIISWSIQPLRTSELHFKTEKMKRIIVDNVILKKLGDSMSKPTTPDDPDHFPCYDGVDQYSA